MIKLRDGSSYSNLWYRVLGDTLYVRTSDGVYTPIKFDIEIIK